MIEKVIQFNQQFVENKGYEPYITSKYPDKKLAILTCMDTRLTELLWELKTEMQRLSKMQAVLSIICMAVLCGVF